MHLLSKVWQHIGDTNLRHAQHDRISHIETLLTAAEAAKTPNDRYDAVQAAMRQLSLLCAYISEHTPHKQLPLLLQEAFDRDQRSILGRSTTSETTVSPPPIAQQTHAEASSLASPAKQAITLDHERLWPKAKIFFQPLIQLYALLRASHPEDMDSTEIYEDIQDAAERWLDEQHVALLTPWLQEQGINIKHESAVHKHMKTELLPFFYEQMAMIKDEYPVTNYHPALRHMLDESHLTPLEKTHLQKALVQIDTALIFLGRDTSADSIVSLPTLTQDHVQIVQAQQALQISTLMCSRARLIRKIPDLIDLLCDYMRDHYHIIDEQEQNDLSGKHTDYLTQELMLPNQAAFRPSDAILEIFDHMALALSQDIRAHHPEFSSTEHEQLQKDLKHAIRTWVAPHIAPADHFLEAVESTLTKQTDPLIEKQRQALTQACQSYLESSMQADKRDLLHLTRRWQKSVSAIEAASIDVAEIARRTKKAWFEQEQMPLLRELEQQKAAQYDSDPHRREAVAKRELTARAHLFDTTKINAAEGLAKQKRMASFLVILSKLNLKECRALHAQLAGHAEFQEKVAERIARVSKQRA